MTILACVLAIGLGGPCERGGEAIGPDRGGHAITVLETPVETGKRMARDRGWVGTAWLCFYDLGNRESGWGVRKWNRAGSGAYGIGQALPASKMARYGRDYMTSAATQVRWMIAYVGGRYGDPCSAIAFHNGHGYY
jgi:resuscitation-promoting factor RpfB